MQHFALWVPLTHAARAVYAFIIVLFAMSLTACGGSNKDHDDDHHHHEHAHHGGRLIYSLASQNDTLKMFDQTVENNHFTSTTVSANANAQLVLSNDGLTIAMLEGGNLSMVSSGLEHLNGDHAHTHDVSSISPSYANVTQVVATGEYFSTLESGGLSRLIRSDNKTDEVVFQQAVYPTLTLAGGDFLHFEEDGSDITMTVTRANGSTENEGLIWLRPNKDGYMTKSISCVDGVTSTAQTEDFTLILCGDGSLRWLISGYDAPEGHPQAGKTLHVTQRYPATQDRREGAIGEVTAGATGFIENITGLTATHHDDNVIAAWSKDQLWLINAHNDHPHRGSLIDITGQNFGNIIAVAATTDDDALAILSDQGTVAISRFEVNSSSNPVATGTPVLEGLFIPKPGKQSQLVAGANSFFVAAQGDSMGQLFQLDFHGEGGEYHLHGTQQNVELKDFSNLVFAHMLKADHDHDHDH